MREAQEWLTECSYCKTSRPASKSLWHLYKCAARAEWLEKLRKT